MTWIDQVLSFLGIPYGVRRYRARCKEDMQTIVPILADFLSKAKRSVLIAAGEMHHLVYNDERIVNVLDRLSENDVKIKIIHSPKLDHETVRLPELAGQGKFKMQRLPKSYRHHFWVIDEKMVLDEDPHYHEQKDRVFYLISDGNFLADKLIQEFERREAEPPSASQEGPVQEFRTRLAQPNPV